jgi:hypothetical protein
MIVAISKEHLRSLLDESSDLTTLGLENSYKEKKYCCEVTVQNTKLWFFTKIRHQINEMRNVKDLYKKEYKLQNKA